MPLTWDATQVANIEELQASKAWNKTAEFCFVLMAVGFSSVTEENWQEIATRCYLYEKVNGTFFSYWEDGETVESPIDAKFVKRHIGYRTNNSKITQTQFLKNLYRVAEEITAYRANALKAIN